MLRSRQRVAFGRDVGRPAAMLRGFMRALFRGLLLLAFGCIVANARSAPAGPEHDLDALLARAAAAERAMEVQEALLLYRQADTLKPGDAGILQKISKQLSDSVSDAKDAKDRRRLAEEALAFARRAADLAPQDPVCVLSLAVCHGKLTALEDTAARIEHVYRVKEYADAALALDPDYAWAHHVLGRWNYELTQVGGPARAMARLFFRPLPRGSCADGVAHLERAVALSPKTAAHHIELGFARLACGDRAGALQALLAGTALPSQEKHDDTEKRRAQPVLARLLKDAPE